eukprot:Seg3104.4 transcript_id=Seg3104.4/GoldUCD/mRNA.D3Y31 product="hypothetical protein" protein_id=Seg3104.4/GoldUCD/D3Y31
MMKKDDSDVLKDIDEDEDLVFLQTRKQTQKTKQQTSKRKNKHKNSTKTKHQLKFTKRHRTKSRRNDIAKRSQIYNMTMPSETMPSNTMPLNTMPSDPVSTNTMPTNTMPDNTMPMNTMNTMPVDTTNYQNNGVETMASPTVNVKTTQSIPDAKPLLQAIEDTVEDDGMFINSSRVCKPGPPLASNNRTPNCLLIGDSITSA